MTAIYVKLIILGSRTLDSVPPKDLPKVAAALIIKGTDDGETYITIDDIPEKYREAVAEELEKEGYDAGDLLG